MTLRLISSNSLGAACLVIAIFLGSMSSAQSQIYYEDSVAPILRKNCIACHNVKLAEGGLNLESPVTAAKGGDSGPAINKTEVAKSSILERASSTDEEMMMPPKGNTVGAERLTEAQLKIIKEWIAGGALSRGTIGNMSLASNLKLPESARATYALAVSPDTDFVAFGRGGQLVIHNARRLAASQSADGVLEPTPVQIIKDAHQDFIHSIAISHDGQRIATGSTGQVKIWKQTNQSVDSIRKNLEQVNVPVSHLFCTSADGSLLATLKKRAVPKDAAPNSLIPGVMTMLNREGEIVYAIDVPNAMLACATWSPSNHRFFTVGVNRILYAWDLNSSPIQAPVQTQLSSDIQWVVAIDETTLLFGSDRKSFVWQYKSPTTAELVADHPLASALNAAGPIDLVSVSLDRTKLVVGTHDEKLETTNLKLWSVPQAKLVGSFERDRRTSLEYQLADRVLSRAQSAVDRSKANVTELEKALQAEETAVKTAQTNKEKSAEAATKKEQERLAAVQAMADHDKQMTETQAAIDAATKKLETLKTELEPKKKAVADLEKQKSEAQTAMENATQSLAATEDSKKAAQSRLEAKKLAVVQQTEELTKVQETSTKLKTIADSVKFSAMAIAFVNENTVATISKTKNESSPPSMVDLFTLDTLERVDSQALGQSIKNQSSLMATLTTAVAKSAWQLERTLDSPRIIVDRVTALAFSADGTKLAMGSGLPSRSGQLAIVGVLDGNPIVPTEPAVNPESDTLELHSDTILGLSYSPDGRWLASCGADKMTKLMEAQTLKVVKVFEGHTHHVMSLAWQDTGHRIATASADSTVKIWDIEKGEAVRTITGFGTEVTALSFIGKTPNIVSSTMNNLVRMHDSDSGKQAKQFSPASDSLYSVAVTPNGRYTLSAGQEGVVRIWQIEDGKMVGEWK